MDEIHAAEQVTGRKTMYAFNITGDLAGLRRRHDLVVGAGGTCVMLTVPVMGLPALAWLRSFSAVPIHGHRGGLAAAMRHPGSGRVVSGLAEAGSPGRRRPPARQRIGQQVLRTR